LTISSYASRRNVRNLRIRAQFTVVAHRWSIKRVT
jgi:hypothetical protein